LLGELEASDRFVIADLEAGTGTVLRLQRGDVDVAVVVTQPTAKAISIAALAAETAHRRGARVIVVANRVATEEDFSRIGGGLADHEIVRVPEDDAIALADRQGRAPIDAASASPAVRALVALADRLSAQEPPANG
jgi:CO dehydrogenase nickel-insertion accessory protein CooC1